MKNKKSFDFPTFLIMFIEYTAFLNIFIFDAKKKLFLSIFFYVDIYNSYIVSAKGISMRLFYRYFMKKIRHQLYLNILIEFRFEQNIII